MKKTTYEEFCKDNVMTKQSLIGDYNVYSKPTLEDYERITKEKEPFDMGAFTKDVKDYTGANLSNIKRNKKNCL